MGLAHAPRAGAGRPPIEDRSKVRNRNEVKGWIDVPDVPFLAGREHELPDTPPGFEWAPQTIAWWDTLRTMPHASLWDDSDWEYAKATAFVHTQLWSGYLTAASELRLRERLMACTWEARRAASIRYVPVEAVETNGDGEVQLTVATPITSVRKPRVRAIDPEARKK